MAEGGRIAFVRLLQRNVVEAAYQHVGRFRQLVFGFDTLQAFIVQGCTPLQLQLAFPTSEALLDAFRSLSRDIVTSTVGQTVAQLAAVQVRTNQTESKDAEDALHIEGFAPMNFDRLFAFIEDEMHNGSLVGDPAWHEEIRSRRRKKRISWRVFLQEVLEDTTAMFDETACKVDWTTALEKDERVKRMSKLDDETLARLVREAYATVPVHLAAGPKKEIAHPSPTKTQEEQDVQRLGQTFDKLVVETAGGD